MADFDVNTITVQGAVAIASATAGDKLVIDGCDATTDVLTQAQAVQIATRPASPASTTDTIGLAGSTDNHVYAYASFIRGESTGGDVHSFLLYGHMESDATNVFVVAVASATATTHIPTSGDVTNRVEIQFELTFSATDEVVTVTDTSMYTTRGEFLILKNRTVTTHAEGQATVGEDQTVYGNKDFKDAVDFNSIYTVQASRTETQGGTNNTDTTYFSPKGKQGQGAGFVAITRDNGTTITGSEMWMSAGSSSLFSGGAGFFARDYRNNTPRATVSASRGLDSPAAGVEVEPTKVSLYTQRSDANTRRTISYDGYSISGVFSGIDAISTELYLYCTGDYAIVEEYFDATTPDATWSIILNNKETDKQARLDFYAGADSGGQLTCASATGGESKLGTGDTPWGEANIGVLKQADGQVLIDDSGVNTSNLNPINSNERINVYGDLIPGISRFCLGSSSGKRWADVYAGALHAGELENDSTELSLYVYGSTTGYSNSHSKIYLHNDDVADPAVEISLKSSSESSDVKYIFSMDNFHSSGKDLGYQNGGEWNNVYANNLHGVLPHPTTLDVTIGSIFFACVKRVSGATISDCTPGHAIVPGDGYIEEIYYGSIKAANAPSQGTAMLPSFDVGSAAITGSNRRYIALSKFEFINGYDYAFGFAMRIA